MGLILLAVILDVACWAVTLWAASTSPAPTSILALVFGLPAVLGAVAVVGGLLIGVVGALFSDL